VRHCKRWIVIILLAIVPYSFGFEAALAFTGPRVQEPVASGRGLTAADAVETTGFVTASYGSDDLVAMSPRGTRYVIRTKKGDLAKNGIWMQVLTGELRSLKHARDIKVAATFFSTGYCNTESEGPCSNTLGQLSPIRWLDEDNITFLFTDELGIRQVAIVDLRNSEQRFITDSKTSITAYSAGPNNTMVYAASSPVANVSNADERLEHGFTIPRTSDLFSLVAGKLDGSSLFDVWKSQWYVKKDGKPSQDLQLGGSPEDFGYPQFRTVSVSPTGEHAFLHGPARTFPGYWDKYEILGKPDATATLRRQLTRARLNPAGLDAREIGMFYLVDLTTGKSRPLWDAIATQTPSPKQTLWSPDGKHLFVNPTHFPLTGGNADFTGLGAAIFNVNTGAHYTIAEGELVEDFKWLKDGSFRVRSKRNGKTSMIQFEIRDGGLRARMLGLEKAERKQPIQMEVIEDAQTPPRLFAHDLRTGTYHLVYDPNPRLKSTFRLATVREMSGALPSGERWDAVLYLPSDRNELDRIPLVIQSGGVKSSNCCGENRNLDHFSLYGPTAHPGLGPSDNATHGAQILAGHGIGVANLVVRTSAGNVREAEAYRESFEAIAHKLVAEGIVDEAKVGLSGFSRNGFFVIHAATRSDFPWAAFTVVDNFDPSYIQTIAAKNFTGASRVIGGAPFGETMQKWLEAAPGFNTERIRAPLRLVGQSYGTAGQALANWEHIAKLQELNRPVELYLMPDIDVHGGHWPQNPRQVVALMQSTTEWFRFWLKNEEDESMEKGRRLTRWRELRAQLGALRNQRASPRLHWNAVPRQLRGDN
jgi:hypothetical protein